MSIEQDWPNDSRAFNPKGSAVVLFNEIGECLQAKDPGKYLERNYSRPSILQRLGEYAWKGIVITGTAY